MEGCSTRDAALRLQRSTDGASVAWATEPERSKLVTKEREVNPPLGFRLDLDPAHPFLAGRGMDAATARYFGVGYCGRRGLMSGRIAIPIHNEDSRLVAYCGRAVDSGGPRYRFPVGFQKSQVLFNYHRARAVGDDRVVVVEGFFDCMRVHQAGFCCVVALMGARLSPAQKSLLAHFSSVLLLLDGDRTGRRATAQIASDLTPACSVMLLPPDMQPDQMTAEQIRQVLTKTEGRTAIN